MSSHFLLYRNDGTIFDLPVEAGPTFGNTAQLGKWDADWTHIRAFGMSGQPYFLLYKQSSGDAFTMPIHTGEEYGVATPCGKWETDWAHMTPFSAGGKDFLLLYRTSGAAFYLPIRSGPSLALPWRWARRKTTGPTSSISTFMGRDSSSWSGKTARRLQHGSVLAWRASWHFGIAGPPGAGRKLWTLPSGWVSGKRTGRKSARSWPAPYRNCCSTGPAAKSSRPRFTCPARI